MSTIRIEYLGDLKAECLHEESGTRIRTDAPKQSGGQGSCFSPTDLCATALATCTVTTMGKTAQVHNINVQGMYATVEKIMSDKPRRIGTLNVHIYVPHDLTEKERLMLERASKTCNMHLTLNPEIAQNIVFHYGA